MNRYENLTGSLEGPLGLPFWENMVVPFMYLFSGPPVSETPQVATWAWDQKAEKKLEKEGLGPDFETEP